MGKYQINMHGRSAVVEAESLEDAENMAYSIANISSEGKEVPYSVTEVDANA